MSTELEIYIKENYGMILNLIRRLCEIPAPSHHEEKRAEFCRNWLKSQGAEGVYIDDAWNVVWEYQCEKHEKAVLFMAHTDTVFPDLEPLGVREEDGRMFSPGVGDNTANVAVLLMMARYLAVCQPETSCGIIIAANSCEEGLGNLKGSRALIGRYGGKLLHVVSFDGYIDEVCTRAVGSRRYRVEIRTEGGHSWFDFGKTSAIACMGSMIDKLYRCPVSDNGSKTTYNVGQVNGGTSVNTIAQQAEFLYEFRSDDRDSLNKQQKYFDEVVESFQKPGVEIEVGLMGERPCGSINDGQEEQIRLQELCRDSICKRTGRLPGYTSASTDCNIPFSVGIPAATVGLCRGGKAHTRQEWIEMDSLREGFAIAADIIGDCLRESATEK